MASSVLNAAAEPPAAVFVVDDDEAVRDSLQLQLDVAGFEAFAFATGAEALGALERRRPACLVVDLHMPVVGGLELVRELAARNLHLPIVMMSGHIDRATRQRALGAGVQVVLHKPFSDDELIDAIGRARQAVPAGAAGEVRTIPHSRPGPTAP